MIPPAETVEVRRSTPQASTQAAASQRGYRVFAPVYDVVFGAGLEHGRRVAIDALHCRTGERVLEVGVGTGLSLRHYPPGVRLTGIDLSNEMLEKALTRLSSSPLAAAGRLLQMDAGELQFADASFDKAALLFTVAGLPDPVRALREVKRVCVPGARIVIASHFRSQRPVARAVDALLVPTHRFLRYRTDLDRDTLLRGADLEVIEERSANLFGYATVLVSRGR